MTEETVYKYTIPLETEDGVEQPAYTPSGDGEQYLYHYGARNLVVIQSKGAGHLHKDEVAVDIEELNKEEVEETDDLVSTYL